MQNKMEMEILKNHYSLSVLCMNIHPILNIVKYQLFKL